MTKMKNLNLLKIFKIIKTLSMESLTTLLFFFSNFAGFRILPNTARDISEGFQRYSKVRVHPPSTSYLKISSKLKIVQRNRL